MSSVTCPECSGLAQAGSNACPTCGFPLSTLPATTGPSRTCAECGSAAPAGESCPGCGCPAPASPPAGVAAIKAPAGCSECAAAISAHSAVCPGCGFPWAVVEGTRWLKQVVAPRAADLRAAGATVAPQIDAEALAVAEFKPRLPDEQPLVLYGKLALTTHGLHTAEAFVGLPDLVGFFLGAIGTTEFERHLYGPTATCLPTLRGLHPLFLALCQTAPTGRALAETRRAAVEHAVEGLVKIDQGLTEGRLPSFDVGATGSEVILANQEVLHYFAGSVTLSHEEQVRQRAGFSSFLVATEERTKRHLGKADDGTLTLTSKRLVYGGQLRSFDIPLASVTSVRLQEGTKGLRDPIKLMLSGKEKEQAELDSLVVAAQTDGRTFYFSNVTFPWENPNRALARLKRMVEVAVRTAHSQSNAPTTAPAAAPAGGEDVVGKIRQLAELRDAGILSEAEFSAKKQDLLSRM